ncbi:Lytic transglycosylase catalytic [Burkholderia sp. MR1]|nr:Lytic transglycosylase catalytic [Burkholderia sp. MR1]
MADSGGTKTIIEIPVDDSAFNAFIEKYQAFRQQNASLPEAWERTNVQVAELGGEFEKAAKEADRLQRAAGNTRVMGDGGFLAKFAHNSRDASKAWREISKGIESSGKHLSGLARMSLSLGSLNKLPGLFGVAGGVLAAGFGAAERTADTLADQNKANRALGLKPGEEQAFDIDYAKAGGDSSLLAKIAAAKSDPREWRYIMAAGVSTDDIKTKSTPELAAEFLEKGSTAYREKGAMFADAVGLTKILDLQGLRLASSYGPADYAEMGQKYRQDVPRLAVQQSTLDEASKAKADFDAGWAQLKTEFLKAGAELIPMATKLTHSAAEMMDAFDKWGGVGKVATEVGKDLTLLGEAADPFIQVLSNGLKAIAPLLPSVGKSGDKADDYVSGVIKEAPHVLLDPSRWKALRDGFEHPTILRGQDAPAAHWDWKHPFGILKHEDAPKLIADPNRAEHIKQLEQRYQLPDGLLDRMEYRESSYGKNLRGPVLKDGQQAKGPMQFLDATAKRYGLSNPDNEGDSLDASAHYLSDLQRQYHDIRKAVAAYNGAKFNASDANWEQNIPKETKDYLAYTLPNMHSAEQFHAASLGTLAKSRDDEERQHQRQLELVRAATQRVGGGGGGPQSPFNINVNVSTPPGSNTAVTWATLPQ